MIIAFWPITVLFFNIEAIVSPPHLALFLGGLLGWKPTTWIGVCVIGFGTAFLVGPPAHGPRLVEGGSDAAVAQVDG